MRRFLIAGNWKMNNGPEATTKLLGGLKKILPEIPGALDVLVCPPAVSLPAAGRLVEDYFGAHLGAQNMHFESEGAFTGEVSGNMLREVGCDYVIIGHSERREYFGETDEIVNKKVLKALEEILMPVICVGESLDQRKADKHKSVVKDQVKAAFDGVSAEDALRSVIAYEPIWAIGTGETATPEQAQEMHEMIRSVVEELYDADTAGHIRILYGGSMKPHNANELLQQEDVDGGLIGGASLKADSFAEIVTIAKSLS